MIHTYEVFTNSNNVEKRTLDSKFQYTNIVQLIVKIFYYYFSYTQKLFTGLYESSAISIIYLLNMISSNNIDVYNLYQDQNKSSSILLKSLILGELDYLLIHFNISIEFKYL